MRLQVEAISDVVASRGARLRWRASSPSSDSTPLPQRGPANAGGIARRIEVAGLPAGRNVDERPFDANAASDLLFVKAMVSAETRGV